MHFSFITAAASLLTLVSATPANMLFVRHNECEYSATTGGVWYTGTCTKDGNYGAGMCTFAELEGSYGCDYAWKNDQAQSPCGNAADSQYACKNEGDPCYAYRYAEGPADNAIFHCSTL
ncbi:hypothetical protein M426DRAFT_103451 [Hypoxylon sp. CI-4A]|nr:hypothetical protein M426DRAFT_103451 [Hypoxylon sp. CI-4A]